MIADSIYWPGPSNNINYLSIQVCALLSNKDFELIVIITVISEHLELQFLSLNSGYLTYSSGPIYN